MRLSCLCDDAVRLMRAHRLIQFGVFAGIAFLCWAPWLAFAFVGRKRLDNTLKSMTAADAGKGAPTNFSCLRK